MDHYITEIKNYLEKLDTIVLVATKDVVYFDWHYKHSVTASWKIGHVPFAILCCLYLFELFIRKI